MSEQLVTVRDRVASAQDIIQPHQAFAEVSASVPEPRKVDGEPKLRRRITCSPERGERCSEVVVLLLQPVVVTLNRLC